MFSTREEKILKVLARRRMTYASLVEEVFTEEDKPFDAEISIGNSVRKIAKKCEAEGLKWTLIRKKQNGKVTVWKIGA